jgi:hypothetical protein
LHKGAGSVFHSSTTLETHFHASEHMRNYLFVAGTVAALVTSCTSDPPGTEIGPQNTVPYTISIEASEPGTKIEVNYKPAGIAPVTVKVFGDRDGTFHNFGSDEYTVRGYPPNADQFPQTKIFKTGAMGVRDDKIPQKIYFDFGSSKSRPQ